MHILNQAVGFYLMHAWIWKPNPAGTFTDWNPKSPVRSRRPRAEYEDQGAPVVGQSRAFGRRGH